MPIGREPRQPPTRIVPCRALAILPDGGLPLDPVHYPRRTRVSLPFSEFRLWLFPRLDTLRWTNSSR